MTTSRPRTGSPRASSAPPVGGADDDAVVSVGSPAELVCAVPHLCGYQPERSVVVVSLRGRRLTFGLVARLDLPADDVPPATLAGHLVPFVLRDDPAQVAVLVYDDQPWRADERPWQALVDALEAELMDRGVSIHEAAYVSRDRFWSYTCTSSTCCPDDGTSLESARSSPVVATLVARGSAPLAARRDVERLVAPADPQRVVEVVRLAEEELGRRRRVQQQARPAPAGLAFGLVAEPDHGPGKSSCADADAGDGEPDACALAELEWERDVLRQFQALVERRRAGGGAGTSGELAVVLAGLRDITVRDSVAMECSAWAWLGPDAGTTKDGRPCRPPRRGDPVAAVLTDLATASDGLWAVGALTLLAMQLWAAGDGGTANVAVDRALRLDPDYRMARLVDQLLRSGTPPAWVERSRAVRRGRDDSWRLAN